ncbi:MAG: helix-turn-helix domain-containing protein [Propionibacteriaceae bacterium]|jgi:DNA-binding XRE family transcriptional regulator|nr:helix-turn-helix domain-containing protein [Propionibacteriaceae bacterium]
MTPFGVPHFHLCAGVLFVLPACIGLLLALKVTTCRVSANTETKCTTSWADFGVKLLKHGIVPTSADREDNRGAIWETRRIALGKRIRTLRIDRGLSQEALALESGLSRNMLIQVEWGQRGLLAERLGDIAEVLGVTASYLLGDDQPDLERRAAHQIWDETARA